MMVFKFAMVICFASISVMATADGEECVTEEQGSIMLQAKQRRESKLIAEAGSFMDANGILHGPIKRMIAGVPVFIHPEDYKDEEALRRHALLQEGKLERGNATAWIIKFAKGCTTEDLDEFIKEAENLYGMTKTFEGDPNHGGCLQVTIVGSEAGLRALLHNHDHTACAVEHAETDIPLRLIPEINETDRGQSLLFANAQAPQNTPLSWGLDRIDDADGLDSSYDNGAGGAGVHVYVCDTGIFFDHNDFGGRAIPTLDTTLTPHRVCDETDKSCALDRQGHGTHCAGTVGGTSYGVAKQAKLHSVKVLTDQGGGSFTYFIDAIDWVASKGQTPAIISASLGGSGNLGAVKDAIDTATGDGVVVVVAAGNENADACSFSPAFVPSAVTVGSTRSTDARSGFSSYGSCLDIYAPGSDITSASHRGQGSVTMSGTSMACPHVAGVTALVRAQLQKHNMQKTAEEVMNIVVGWGKHGRISDAKESKGSPNIFLFSDIDVTVPAPPTPAPTPVPATPAPPPCFDTDNGAADPYGDNCAAYAKNPSWCGGAWDDSDFSNTQMCCTCGGGGSGSPTPVPATPAPQPTPPPAPTPPGTCGSKGPDESPWGGQIVNGQQATECEWKWQAALRTPSGFSFCGASLIHPKWVMTAAHCTAGKTPSSLKVVLGDFDKQETGSNEVEMSVSKIVDHPSYNSGTMDNDFSLIELTAEAPVGTNSCIGTVCLPSEPIAEGQQCWITGWGTLSSGGGTPRYLQEAAVTTLSNSACTAKYGGGILSSMLCAQGAKSNGDITDACQGDSGGPLVCQDGDGTYSLHGATSWGRGCAQAQYPGVWARITEVLTWIHQEMGTSPNPSPSPSWSPQPAPAPAPYASFASSVMSD